MKIILTEKEVCDAIAKQYGRRLKTDESGESFVVCTTLLYDTLKSAYGAELTIAEEDPK